MHRNTRFNSSIELAPSIHQAALNPHLSLEELHEICDSASYFNFGGLCTNPTRIAPAREKLSTRNQTKLIAVISFPFGTSPSKIKKKEAELAIDDGADQLDIVPNFFFLNKQQIDIFAEEISIICEFGLPVRVILDFVNLSPEKQILAVDAAIDAGAQGIQNGNGFGPSCSKIQILKLADICRGRCAIKAAGGIKDLHQALELIEAGASQLGTSWGGQLMKELMTQKND